MIEVGSCGRKPEVNAGQLPLDRIIEGMPKKSKTKTLLNCAKGKIKPKNPIKIKKVVYICCYKRVGTPSDQS